VSDPCQSTISRSRLISARICELIIEQRIIHVGSTLQCAAAMARRAQHTGAPPPHASAVFNPIPGA